MWLSVRSATTGRGALTINTARSMELAPSLTSHSLLASSELTQHRAANQTTEAFGRRVSVDEAACPLAPFLEVQISKRRRVETRQVYFLGNFANDAIQLVWLPNPIDSPHDSFYELTRVSGVARGVAPYSNEVINHHQRNLAKRLRSTSQALSIAGSFRDPRLCLPSFTVVLFAGKVVDFVRA